MNRLIRTSRNFNCTLYRVIARGILTNTTKTFAKTEVIHRVLAVVLAIFVPVFGYIYLYTPTLAPVAIAAPNNTINFQARLLTNTGALIPDGNYHIEFKIYDSASAGSSAQGTCSGDSSTDDCWWRETRTTGNLVTVKNGYITANLGSVTSFPSNMPWDQELWLAMNIGGNGGSATWDGEMSPRMKITAVPYAMRSAEATQLKVNNGAITSTLNLLSPTGGNQVFQIQDQGSAGTYNLCVQNSTACGFAPSATNGYVQLAPNSVQADATTNSSIYINKTGASGNLLQLQKNGSDVFTINNTGAVLLQGSGTLGYTSPGGNTVLSQRFGIASAVLGATETQIRLGVASGSNAGSTAITAFDGRTSTDNNPTISVVSPAETGVIGLGWDGQDTRGYLKVNSGAGFAVRQGTNNILYTDGISGAVAFRPYGANSAQSFAILNSAGDLKFNYNAQTDTIGMDTDLQFTGAQSITTTTGNLTITPESGNAKIILQGALDVTGSSISSFTTPQGSGVTTKINIPLYNPGVFNQVLAIGLPNTAGSSSRGLSIFDNRTAGDNQPVLSVFTPDETQVFGLNTDGSNTTGYLKSSGIDLGVKIGTTTTAIFENTGELRINGTLDTISANTLSIGTANATQINLDKNTVVANNQSFTANGASLFKNATSSATAFQIQDTGNASLLTANTLTRTGGVAGNVLKVGNSTGTDTDTTLLVLDGTTANPTTNLASLNGALFYNTTTNKVSAVENGAVVEVCTTGAVCSGYAPSATNGYVQLAPASAQTDATTNSSIFINKTGASGNILQLQNNGSDVFRIGNTGNATFFRNITLTGTTTANYNFQIGATVQSTDTNSQYSLQNQTTMDVSGLAGTLTTLYGHLNAQTISNGAGKTITNVYGLSARAPVNNGATITTRYAIQADGSTGNTGTITNNYGLYVNDLSGVTATNNFPIYVKASGSYALFSVNSTGATIFRNSTNSSTAFQVQASGSTNPILNVDTSNSRVGINTSAPSADLTFGDGTNRTINVLTRTSAGAGNNLSVVAGAGNGANNAGGALYLQGGQAGTGNANGGNVFIQGGNGIGTGAEGLVIIDTPTFTTATTQNCAVDCTITQSNVDGSGAVIINATASSLIISLPDPTILTAGRVVYVTAANTSNDFTLRVNGGGQGNDIAMRQNTTATMIWNGNDWTAAGASSSTTLQAAYDNTLSSAGGAEIVLNNTATSNGLTVRNNATSPIIGGIFETQTSIGSNLFSVNNNATEFATNGGAETQGASASAFPANTWDSTTGGIVDRWTTTGDNVATGAASVRVQASAINHGARNRISATLTSGLTYSVSFAVRGATNFSTLDVRYSPDGTILGTTQCSTAEVVTSGIWTRINCTFVASGTITASNSILIRQTDGTTRTFYIDNLSVNINASATYASDGSVDNPGTFATNWTAFDGDGGGAGTATAVRDTTVLYDSSASARVDTSNHANMGIRNNLSIAPAINTQYLVSFYARSATGAVNDLTVRYSRNGGTNFVNCVDYSTQVINTTGWTKVSCLFTTDGTSASNADLVISQNTAPGGTRSIYIDALSITLNTNNANNVQIGGANKGGPTTLFTLDRSDSAPIAANNDAYLGSMYYDTTTGRIQCYEADGWGACGSAPDNIVNLNPEYAGAVLNGTGVGTMTADLCADQSGVLQVNASLCDGTGSPAVKATNFYRWTSPQASQQTYSIYVSYQLPTTFKGFASDDTVQLTSRVDSTTNAAVTYEMFKSEGGTLTKCGTGETAVTTNANEWQTVGINGNESTGCGFNSSSGGAYVIFKINVKANSNANAYVSTLSFVTTGK